MIASHVFVNQFCDGHLEISSDLLLSSDNLFAFMMQRFSVRRRLNRFLSFEQGTA